MSHSTQQNSRTSVPAPGEGAVPELDVCLASPLFHPEYSGAALRFRRYAPGLLERGVRLRVIAAELGTWRAGESCSRAEGAEEGSGPIQVSRIPIPRDVPKRKARRSYARGVLAACQDPETRPDVLISLTRLPAPVLMRLRHLGVPVMYVKTMFDDSSQDAWRRWKKRVLATVHHRLVDRVVVSTDVMHDSLPLGGAGTRV